MLNLLKSFLTRLGRYSQPDWGTVLDEEYLDAALNAERPYVNEKVEEEPENALAPEKSSS
tara:strand:- start:46 stop:225 length:180 start_codon:yes stop_codon:yes gene_type:complete